MSGTRQTTAPEVAKRELGQFLRMAEDIGLDTTYQRRWLHMSPEEWQGWVGILQDEPLPPRPALPLLLRRLGHLNNRLDRATRFD
jgi:hypothetical protein